MLRNQKKKIIFELKYLLSTLINYLRNPVWQPTKYVGTYYLWNIKKQRYISFKVYRYFKISILTWMIRHSLSLELSAGSKQTGFNQLSLEPVF